MLKQQRKSATGTSHPAQLPIGDIVPDPNQPRKSIAAEKLNELKQSLRVSGQISPVVVRPVSDGKYMIVVGERRWRAAKESGFSHIDCIIRHDLDDQKTLELQFAENCQREDISPLEQARALKGYLDTYGISGNELARRTGLAQRTVSARLKLLSLPLSMQAKIEREEIGPHEALMISGLPPSHQDTVLSLVSSGKLGGRALENVCALSKTNPSMTIDEIINRTEHGAFVSPSEVTEVPTSLESNTPVPSSVMGGSSLSASQLRDIAALIEIVKWLGICKQQECDGHHNDGRCTFWKFDSGETIPEVIEDSALPKSSDGVLRPSVLLCGICNGPDAYGTTFTQKKLFGDPLAGLKENFKCDCGAKGEVAVSIKCTKCGKETWRGWWPK